ncbi:MAG TPA: hypothetical protein VM241_01630 [Candidatus Thermoplasmatota archaeon]|nr:hypothetical protein [Candidatus Thermoplasmatota archaeon]
MTEPKLPFYHRLWWWTVAAPLLLLLVAGAAVVVWGFSNSGGYVVTITHFTGAADGPTYNLTDEEAASLPGHIPQALEKASREGSVQVTLSSSKEVDRLSEGFHHGRYVRFHGAVFKVESLMVIN